MTRASRFTLVLLACSALFASSALAYDIPQRKIEIKPYINLLMPSDFWMKGFDTSVVEDDLGFGIGAKLRTQFAANYGLVLNVSYTDVKVSDIVWPDATSDVTMFTLGGYLSKEFGFGRLTADCGFGLVVMSDEGVALLMPSLEYSRPVAERISLAAELGWPIANDWLRDFGFEESYGSFTFSVGAVIVF
jgi:hypothetical protein